jgi:hypothetical protein
MPKLFGLHACRQPAGRRQTNGRETITANFAAMAITNCYHGGRVLERGFGRWKAIDVINFVNEINVFYGFYIPGRALQLAAHLRQSDARSGRFP